MTQTEGEMCGREIGASASCVTLLLPERPRRSTMPASMVNGY